MHRKLFNLAQANAGKGAGIRSETDGDVANIYVYDIIDAYWGISAQDFVRTVANIEGGTVNLHINSPGGDVFEARAMMAAIAEHKATFTAKIDGLCASAATALSLACDTVEIVEGGFYMIHKAWTLALGNADDMRASADLLDKVDGVLADGYAKKAGMDREAVIAAMAAETWYTAEEAFEAGFADAVIEIGGAKNAALGFDVKAYDNAPSALTETPAEPDWNAALARRSARARLYERSAA
jgi:ATP-dependent protease ClpP protease subunit